MLSDDASYSRFCDLVGGDEQGPVHEDMKALTEEGGMSGFFFG